MEELRDGEVAQALQAHDLDGAGCGTQRWRLEAVRDRIAARLAELTAVQAAIDEALDRCASGECTLLDGAPAR